MWVWDQVVKEWPLVSAAPLSIITLIVAFTVLGWIAGRFMYGQTIEGYRSQFAAAEAQTESVQERLRLRDDQLAAARVDLEAARQAEPVQADKIVAELRERLEALAPYGLPKKAEQRMIDFLKEKPSTVRITIVLGATDSDSLYRQVMACFRAAGWTLVDSGQIWKLSGAPDSGVTVLTWDSIPAEDVVTIKSALEIAGLDPQVRLNDPNAAPLPYPQITFSSRDPNYQAAARWA